MVEDIQRQQNISPHPPQCLGRPRGVHAAKQPRRSARRRRNSAWPLSSVEHKSRLLLLCRRCRRWKLSLLGRPGFVGPSVGKYVVVRFQSRPRAVLPQRPCDLEAGRGPSGGHREEGGVGCGRGGEGGGVDLRRRPRNLLRTPPLRYCPPRPSTAPSSQPSSVLERSAAESLARTLVALVRCKFAPAFCPAVEFSTDGTLPESDRTTNAWRLGTTVISNRSTTTQGLRPVDSTTVADTQVDCRPGTKPGFHTTWGSIGRSIGALAGLSTLVDAPHPYLGSELEIRLGTPPQQPSATPV